MLLKPSANLDPYEPTEEYPLFVQPGSEDHPGGHLQVLEGYLRGTVLDEYGAQDEQFPTMIDPISGHYRLSPAWGKSA